MLRPCVGNDIEILWLTAKKQVTNTTPDKVSFIAGIFESIEDFECILADVSPRDTVRWPRDYGGNIDGVLLLIIILYTQT